MLETLRIQNYALIDEVEVDFRPGFNALTGETGAGKSILVGALNLVLGARASGDLLRAGAARASIEAVFRVSPPSPRLAALFKEHDIQTEDGALLLSRTLSQDGRSRGYAGGKLVPIAVLAALGDELVDLHGQHEHQSLLKTDRQLGLLDGYAKTESAAEAVAASVGQLHTLEREIAALALDDRERERQIEFLRFELEEIDGAGLAADEEAQVRQQLNVITNAERIVQLASEACRALYDDEDNAAADRLSKATQSVLELAAIEPSFQELHNSLEGLYERLRDAADTLRGRTEAVEFDPAELDRLNERLSLIGSLKRKYGESLGDVLAYAERARERLAAYEQRDERLDALRERRETLLASAERDAQALSRKRKSAAGKLDKQVAAALRVLGMKDARFETAFEPVPLCSNGLDRVVFMLAANAGEKVKALRQVASGGEVSRIMLALKSVFSKADQIPTLIFDEIDAGVGGAVARKVADKIGALAKSHQILCITHIPQIAAVAQAHFRVTKQTTKKRTTTQVTAVAASDRVEEMARLLDGSVSEVSLEHARELLAEKRSDRMRQDAGGTTKHRPGSSFPRRRESRC